ncbi:DUF2855 family protein [Eisenibacter elegans]|uniref:DUF2855 family protein n=1 Tax=Eisenibacter elegans TaxID=997 RepID=UPI0004090299|nr:DUF2855 family protein [Eisenibacter elegans]
MTRFITPKNNPTQLQAQQSEAMPDVLEDEVLFRIEKYALTANNLTYAVMGERLRYWEFFPEADTANGVIPVWGFAEVMASNHPDISEGERFYGYFPMAKYLKVLPGHVSDFGFTDTAPHRRELASVYNYYNQIHHDPSYQAEVEDYLPVLKPLFVTSFLNYHFLYDQGFKGATQILLTSASSKTALGLAFMLKQQQVYHNKLIIGLTSEANLDFVRQTGYYDQVYTYQQWADIALKPSLIVDFAGNAERLQQLSLHLGELLKYISLIGLADWQAAHNFKTLPQSEFFFAPTVAKQKFAEWGIVEANQKIATQFLAFVDQAKQSLAIHYLQTPAAVAEVYTQLVEGTVDPSKAYIVQI